MPSTPQLNSIFSVIFCCIRLKTSSRSRAQSPNQRSSDSISTSTPSAPVAGPEPVPEPSTVISSATNTPYLSSPNFSSPPVIYSETEPTTDTGQSNTPHPIGDIYNPGITSSPPQSITMFATPLSPTLINQACLEIQSLKTYLASIPHHVYYTQLIPQTISIVQRQEVRRLFGPDGDSFTPERLRICDDLLEIAYWEVDAGGNSRLTSPVERCLGRVLEVHPSSPAALLLMGRAWLLKAQQYLAKIPSEDGSHSSNGSGGSGSYSNPAFNDWTSTDEDRDIVENDRKRQEGVYVDARTCLMPAVEFLGGAVEVMGRRVDGDTLLLQAEANMSMGNVSVSSEAQDYFRTAVAALKMASMIDGFTLPTHMARYLRTFEFVLYD